jgi:Flp pilus assembly protein TadG
MFSNPIKSRRRRGKARRGATAIEFVMVAPAFLIVITVCCEFSRMCMLRNVAQNACYESTRLIISEGATVEDGIDRAQLILNRLGSVQATITVNGSDGPDEDGNVENEIQFDTQTVTTRVEIELKNNAVILPGSMFGDNRIVAQMTLNTERYRGFFDASTASN